MWSSLRRRGRKREKLERSFIEVVTENTGGPPVPTFANSRFVPTPGLVSLTIDIKV